MSAAQHQALVLGGVSFVAFIVFLCFLLPSRGTKFSVFAACNLLFVALMFGAVGLIDLAGGRAEIVVAVMTELPVVLIVAWVCLALAGGLPSRLGALPAEPVARRPWLRALLVSAPLVLVVSFGIATVVGLLWPSPALRVFAPAPPQFFVLKGLMMAPEGLYSGLAAVVFVMAGWTQGLKRRFYYKNLAFAVGMVCIASIAIESTIFAGLRVWFSDEGRRALLETLNTLEACLAIVCILAFIAGLSLRYTPAVAATLLYRLQSGWLHAQEEFESHEWQAVSTGAADRLAHASRAVVEACHLRGLSTSDTQRALATIRLVAVMRDPSSETQHITPDAARKLYEFQQEILCDDVLASKISWAAGWRSRAHEPQTVKSAPLHDALKAALELVDNDVESEGERTPPLWYYIVAVSAADAKMIDPAQVSTQLRDGPEHRAAVEAYDSAKRLLRRIDDGDREGRTGQESEQVL
jgi:hypothetical protein